MSDDEDENDDYDREIDHNNEDEDDNNDKEIDHNDDDDMEILTERESIFSL